MNGFGKLPEGIIGGIRKKIFRDFVQAFLRYI